MRQVSEKSDEIDGDAVGEDVDTFTSARRRLTV